MRPPGNILLLFFFLALPLLSVGCGSDETPVPQQSETEEPARVEPATTRSSILAVSSPAPGDTLRGGKFRLKGEGTSGDSLLHYRLLYDTLIGVAWGDLAIAPRDSTTPAPFSREVSFSCDWGGRGRVEVFDRDPETGQERGTVQIPVVILTPVEGDSVRTIYAYFPNRDLGSIADCSLVFPLARELSGDSRSLARAAVYYLLRGVTEEEKGEGYFSRIPDGLRLNSITLEEGLATLDFSHHLMQLDRSCGIDRVRSQIEQTLAQFQTVDAVVIRVDGRVWTAGRR